MAKREFATLHGYIIGQTTTSEVRVLARSEGYAMVRRKGCMPFVVAEKKLTPLEPGTAQEEANHD
jgi:hypothetical protein